MEKREILFCNLIISDGKKEIKKNGCVILIGDTVYKNKKIIKTEVIKSLGFESKSQGFTEGVKSEEKRNDITGSYD